MVWWFEGYVSLSWPFMSAQLGARIKVHGNASIALQGDPALKIWSMREKKRWLKSRRSMVAWDSQIKTYVLNIHNIPKIFWGAWPLTTLERPKCSKVWVPLSKLSVSKNVWFTNAILGPLDFIHSEMLKRGMVGGSGPPGKQRVETTISGAGPPLWASNGYL